MAANRASADQKKVQDDAGVLLFEDECIFQQSGTILRSWALRGIGRDVRSKPVRRSCKVFGAISVDRLEPKLHFRFAKDKFNTASFVAFLRRLVKYYAPRKQRIHLIVDGVRYHRSALTWVNSHREAIELHFLPPYSPNLNAAEQVWRRTKRDATHNRYFPTLEMLRQALSRRFNRFQGNPAALRGLVKRWL